MPTNYLPSYKVYTALLTQTGTNAPVAIILQNDFEDDFIFSYVSSGFYTINSNGLFLNNKTIAYFIGNFPTYMAYNESILINIDVNNQNQIAIYVGNDDFLLQIPIEIRVYS